MTGAAGREGSTGRLLQLCLGYFVFYLITGLTVKYFLGSAEEGFPGMHGMEFLVYSTLGGNAIALSVVLVRRWYHLRSNRLMQVGPWKVPSELLYIVPSGVCTAVVIPTTTLMYTLPISVMVAMVIMRGSVILLSRLIDAIQIRQGILDKKVYWEENLGVVFAVLAVGVHLVGPLLGGSDEDHFGFFKNPIAMGILGSYISAYGIRIYIMNYYKNTRPKGAPHDNRGFFAFEQIAASITMVLAVVVLLNAPALFDWNPVQLQLFSGAIRDPLPGWGWAVLAGMAFGIVSFFSVFIFMFKGRTATFAGLVNRLTSLIAGTASTLLFALGFGGRWPERWDWISLGFILMAVALLTRAERKRTAELAAARA